MNTSYDLFIPLEEMAVWDPISESFEYDGDVQNVKVILWKGHCSVHANFTVENIKELRQTRPETNIIVHPECSREVVGQSDYDGSTKYIIETIKNAKAGTSRDVGTEKHHVNRFRNEQQEKDL